ncbi:mechanosensitive ion channel family protein [Paraburkholderia silvatlantica]|uniref:Small-conductance mechanosensitive channel n=1 Tax=Paraburkholderia silvatlantica TaxID=321895 RepID=A0ABR6FW75_9BURK|nr:mechanosensitive ion channel family protein [Paraburkholderia silvatlantica]MBB2931675.1 small-conductance mechanosensitive channel [Paraburkholderia silvatlantica]PVY26323.1 small-conductance mechanosensitive channel [Paraburkholderia silvatlantica]PXW32074.1 small-conductance mechanosensitive channel [Paraburkholderia silvatlantica]TDQ82654.1 small-conductance mechanosensitive channel [Paraburkholderia silvatlantica]
MSLSSAFRFARPARLHIFVSVLAVSAGLTLALGASSATAATPAAVAEALKPGASPAHPAQPAAPATNANAANPAAPVALTPTQAQAALQVLDDPVQRGHMEDTLRAIAAAGALAVPASASAPASAPAAASGAAAATPASAPLAGALRSNGLVVQIADHAAHGARMIGQHLNHTFATLLGLWSTRNWWQDHLNTPQGHALLLALLRVLLLTLVPALALATVLRRVVASPERAIAAHQAAKQREDAARSQGGTPPPQPQTPEATGTSVALAAQAKAADAKADAEQDALREAAGMEPADGKDDKDSDPNAGPNANANANAAARATVVAAQAGDNAGASPKTAADRAKEAYHALRGAHHWRLLQRLPGALLVMLLEVVPVIAFGLCAAGVLSLFGPDDAAPAEAVGQIVDTYVICRVIVMFGKLLFAPGAAALRLVPLPDDWAAYAQRWLVRVVVIGGVGGALGGAVPLGMTEDAHLALVKVVTLVVHLALAVIILQLRRPVADAMRAAAARHGSYAWFMQWFADIWVGVALFVVLALWFVWALDLRGGYAALLRAGGLSLVVLLAARVSAIVLLGALSRVFGLREEQEKMSFGQRRAYRYYPALRRCVVAAIWIVTLDLLLHVWDLRPARILALAPIGHMLGSALLTIVIAVFAAVAIWEFANGAAERRLNAWTDAGDFVRAARLRTLLPMFRTTLLVSILVVVGLTALSQLGVNTAPLIAGASIFGVALGFGSQKLVQDFITGIFLLTENAMQVGDWVTVAGVSGTVEFLSIRTVRLRGGDGSLYTVPFSSVTTVNNTNRGIGNAAVKVQIAHGADLQRAIDTLKDIGAEIRKEDAFKDGILSDFAYWGVDQVDGAAVTLVGQIQCKDSTRWGVQREFNKRVLLRFTERGIELANPQRNFLVGMARGDDVEGHTYGDDHDDDATDNDRTRAQARGASTKAASQGGKPRTGRAGASGDGNGSSSGKPN